MRLLAACVLGCALLAGTPAAKAVDYTADVKPILSKHCYSCHGALRQKSGLRLDHVSFIRAGGDSGPAIAANAANSALVRAITGSGDIERMPLDAKPLADEEIATLKAWIEEGAKAPDEPLPDDPRQHWSFQKPVRADLPTPSNPLWAQHPIDRFLAAEHESRGLTPSPEAPKNLLLRRVYLDLIGLPPTPQELREFTSDASADAYERVVDKLLASPQYGERWGRHWMDVWRYSDWDGYAAEVRESQPHIWRWRDWIVEGLNADRPYDQMIVEMLAADEIAPSDTQALRATGFLVRNWYKFNRNVWLEGTVEHTSKAFLGVTLNCARCHDHMYDPILQEEYYQFRALFEPHDVRTDRIPGQSDTARDGLVRVYDAKNEEPTYLFQRGNEAKPDKTRALPPGVPRVLGGELRFESVKFSPSEQYPGLRDFVVAEVLNAAQAEADRAEAAMGKTHESLVAARKKLTDFNAAAKTAAADTKPGDAAQPAGNVDKGPSEGELKTQVEQSESAAALAEQDLLAAAANPVAVRAKIEADRAAFARPPAANASQLARDASRAERVANVEQARLSVLRLEQQLAAAKATSDDAGKKKAADAENKLKEAHKARDAATAALGQTSEKYQRFTGVYPETSTGRRAALARWIASKDNPLTARVSVNQMWMRHFGTPLVPTVFDFGLNGRRPTHPGLLDWLAVELMDQGWKMKPIHRLIVTSRAYRMQSWSTDDSNRAIDAENAYLWRMNSRRMEAEIVRDSTLHTSGSLDLAMGGADLDQKTGLKVPRRSIYFRSSKEKKVTFLEMFDSPNVTDCYRRSETVVPQQALAMVNSSLTLAESRRLAGMLQGEAAAAAESERPKAFVASAFERILCRQPTIDETNACLEFLASQTARLADEKSLVAFASGDECPVKPSSDPAQRARENLVHVLFNHNDFLTVR